MSGIEASVFIWSTFQCVIILMVILYLLWGYANRKQNNMCYIFVVVVGWFMSFSVIVFIPLDIYLNSKYTNFEDEATGTTATEDALLLDYWIASYWSSNFLNWIVIPLLQGYVLAGEFIIFERIYRAIIFNVPIFLLFFLAFIALLLTVFFIDNHSDKNILNE